MQLLAHYFIFEGVRGLQTLFGYFDVEIIPQEKRKFSETCCPDVQPFLSYFWTTYSYFHSGFRKSLSCKHLIRQTLLDNVGDDDDRGDNGDDDGDDNGDDDGGDNGDDNDGGDNGDDDD